MGGSLLSPQLCRDCCHCEGAEETTGAAPSSALRCWGEGTSAPITVGGMPVRCGARWGLRAAQNWFQLILLAPRGLAALASARVTLGRGRAGLSPPSHPCWHCHPATSKGDGTCPVPACASLPSTPVCLSGDRFCAILNNSIFIGPTKTYHPRSAHTPPVCVPPHPCRGATYPQCLSHALTPSIPLFPLQRNAWPMPL